MNDKIKVTKSALSITKAIFNSPHRVRIILLLTKKKLSISEISKRLKISRERIGYHLSGLEEVGLLKSEYQIINKPQKFIPGKTRKVYEINKSICQEMIDIISAVLSTIQRMQNALERK